VMMLLPEGMTREAAETLAELTAAERRKRILAGRTSMGEEAVSPRKVTVEALLEAYHHSEVAKDWKARTMEDRELFRQFWEGVLGRDAEVLALTPSMVRKATQDGAERSGTGPQWERKRLAYLRAAVRWAELKARLIPENPLRGLELPAYEPDTDELVYSLEETARLLTPHGEVDWRVTLAANIAYDTGRRISSILALTLEDLMVEGDRLLLHFRPENDKRGRGGVVAVSEPTALLVASALEEGSVSETGWLFPEGRLEYVDEIHQPLSRAQAILKLHQAEAILGVKTVRKRAYHGLKRTHVTASMELSHGDTALVGDLTGNLSADLLRRIYRKRSRKRITAQVDAVRSALPGAGEGSPEGGEEALDGPHERGEDATVDATGGSGEHVEL
jgi:integrase